MGREVNVWRFPSASEIFLNSVTDKDSAENSRENPRGQPTAHSMIVRMLYGSKDFPFVLIWSKTTKARRKSLAVQSTVVQCCPVLISSIIIIIIFILKAEDTEVLIKVNFVLEQDRKALKGSKSIATY